MLGSLMLSVSAVLFCCQYCQLCQRGDNEELLLLCDGCDKGCHTYCHNPQITTIPEGDWFCPACIAKVREAVLCVKVTKKKKYKFFFPPSFFLIYFFPFSVIVNVMHVRTFQIHRQLHKLLTTDVLNHKHIFSNVFFFPC